MKQKTIILPETLFYKSVKTFSPEEVRIFTSRKFKNSKLSVQYYSMKEYLRRLELSGDNHFANKKKRIRKRDTNSLKNDLKKIKKELIGNRKIIKCAYCKTPTPVGKITADHYIPFAKNHEHKKDNIKLCCNLCNHIKGSINPTTNKKWKNMMRNPWRLHLKKELIQHRIDIMNGNNKQSVYEIVKRMSKISIKLGSINEMWNKPFKQFIKRRYPSIWKDFRPHAFKK